MRNFKPIVIIEDYQALLFDILDYLQSLYGEVTIDLNTVSCDFYKIYVGYRLPAEDILLTAEVDVEDFRVWQDNVRKEKLSRYGISYPLCF